MSKSAGNTEAQQFHGTCTALFLCELASPDVCVFWFASKHKRKHSQLSRSAAATAVEKCLCDVDKFGKTEKWSFFAKKRKQALVDECLWHVTDSLIRGRLSFLVNIVSLATLRQPYSFDSRVALEWRLQRYDMWRLEPQLFSYPRGSGWLCGSARSYRSQGSWFESC